MVPVISVIVPMFNEEDGLEPFFARLGEVLSAIDEDFEIICVNDGSRDGTLKMLQARATKNERIKVIDLSRNFGKEAALTAGLDHAIGKAVIPIDADLQDPPELIGAMVKKWREGFDVVVARRVDRSSDSWLKRITALLFYRLMAQTADIEVPSNVGDFRLMDRKVVEAIKLIPERTRFMKGLLAWVGFKTTTIDFTREKRAAGNSSWRYWKLWNFALDGIVSFTTFPLRIWSYVGFISAFVALFYMTYIVSRTLFSGVDLPGYASIVSMILFFNGLIMISLGVLGEYVGRIFIEAKKRPIYIVRDQIGFGKKASSTTLGRSEECLNESSKNMFHVGDLPLE